jgi:hypothetical protein
MYFVLISKQTAIISPYSFNQLGFIIQTQCVYWEVRTNFIIQGKLRLKKVRCSSQNVSTRKQRIETHNSSVFRISSSFSYMGLTYFKKCSVYLFFREFIGGFFFFFAEFLCLPRKYFFTCESEPMSELCALLIALFVCPSHKFRKIQGVFPQTQHLYRTESLYFFSTLVPFLGTIAELRKVTISFVVSLRPSVRPSA